MIFQHQLQIRGMTLPSFSPSTYKRDLVLGASQLLLHGSELMLEIFNVFLHVVGSRIAARGQRTLNSFGRHSHVQTCSHCQEQHFAFKYWCFPNNLHTCDFSFDQVEKSHIPISKCLSPSSTMTRQHRPKKWQSCRRGTTTDAHATMHARSAADDKNTRSTVKEMSKQRNRFNRTSKSITLTFQRCTPWPKCMIFYRPIIKCTRKAAAKYGLNIYR